MRIFRLILMTLAALGPASCAAPDEDASASNAPMVHPPTASAYPGVRPIMALKLDHAQQLLGGVVRNDFQAVAEHARALDHLSQQAQWQVRDSMSYQLLSAEFRRIARAIEADAVRRDGDAVMEHYTQLTRTCVECHKHVRQDGGLRGSDVIRTMAPPRDKAELSKNSSLSPEDKRKPRA